MADRSGYIGRAPSDSSVTIARQTYNVSGSTTDFTFSSGYNVGLIDVYLNGAKLINISDYTATNGSTITLLVAASDGDVVEIVAYKAFNLGSVSSATGNFSIGGNADISGNLTVDGTSNITGNALFSNHLTVNGDGIFNGNITGDGATNISGINSVTATSFYGSGANLSDVISGVEIEDDGTSVGSGATTINFSGFTATPVSSGITTVSISQSFSVGTRASSVTISLAAGTFTVTGRSSNTVISV